MERHNIYFAARYGRRKEMQEYAAKLEALGHHISSHWIDGRHEGPEWTDEMIAKDDLKDLDLDLTTGGDHMPKSCESNCGHHFHPNGDLSLSHRRRPNQIVVETWGFRDLPGGRRSCLVDRYSLICWPCCGVPMKIGHAYGCQDNAQTEDTNV